MISRQVRINLIEQTINAIGPDHQDRRPLLWRGQDVPWPVVQIPVTHALLNPYSHRIKAQVGSDAAHEAIRADPFGDDSQKAIAGIIRKTPQYARLKAILARDKQQEPGVMTRAGVLINANTRLVALRELNIGYIKVQILPPDATPAELTELELGFQMRPETRQDYSFTNSLLFIKDLLDDGWIPQRIGLEMDRSLDEDKESDRKKAVQRIETDARLLQLIETIRATSGGKIPYEYFDAEIQNIRDIDNAYETQRKKNPHEAQRVRDAKIVGMLADLDYRKVREIDETLLNSYVLPALEEEEPLKAITAVLANGASTTAEGEDLLGLDILDSLTETADPGSDEVSLLPIYQLLATADEDGEVAFPATDNGVVETMPTRVFAAAVNKALTLAIDIKEQDSKGKDQLQSPMRYLSVAASSCDRARDALKAVAAAQGFSIGKLRTAYEDYMRSHDELSMMLEELGIQIDESGDR
ncbi:hypothetical protein ACWIGW_24385 [Nocardia brasiliensis]